MVPPREPRLNDGDLVGAATAFEEASQLRGGLEGWAIADFRASLALAQGHFGDGDRLADAAHAIGGPLGDTNDGIHALQRWNSARLTGDLDAAGRWHEQSAATLVGLMLPTGPLTALGAERLADARDLLAVWVHDVVPLTPMLMRYTTLPWVSELAFRLDELTGLQVLVDYAEHFAGDLLSSDAGLLGAADVARGRFAAVQGDLDRAVSLLETGHALHTRLELHALVVESGLDLARVHLRRSAPQDRERATDFLTATIGLARELGMTPSLEQARALLP